MQFAAALVHLFTALGSVTALLALLAIANQAWELAFLWLGAAFIIDGVDGTFARWVKVVERLPRFSGERLDLVVDYVTYVFIPAYALLAAGFLEGTAGMVLASLILLSSLFHFADTESKAEDYSFIGFPAVWNIVAFYLFVFRASPAVSAAVVVLCAVLTFVPMKWVHPLRVARLRWLVAAACCAWAVAAFAAAWGGFPATPLWSKAILLAVALAVIGLSLVSSWTARQKS